MDVLEHPALSIYRSIRLGQRRCHGDSTRGAWSRLVKEARVARFEIAKQLIERLLEVLMAAAAHDMRSVHFAKAFDVDLAAAELRIDQRDHFIEYSASLRFREEGHR
jgi:hypothetical protein